MFCSVINVAMWKKQRELQPKVLENNCEMSFLWWNHPWNYDLFGRRFIQRSFSELLKILKIFFFLPKSARIFNGIECRPRLSCRWSHHDRKVKIPELPDISKTSGWRHVQRRHFTWAYGRDFHISRIYFKINV